MSPGPGRAALARRRVPSQAVDAVVAGEADNAFSASAPAGSLRRRAGAADGVLSVQ